MKRTLIICAAFLCVAIPGFAWDGYDYGRGSFVEIEGGNLVRSGSDIEFFDYGDGSYHYADVESVQRSGGSVEVEVFDTTAGEYRTLDMNN